MKIKKGASLKSNKSKASLNKVIKPKLKASKTVSGVSKSMLPKTTKKKIKKVAKDIEGMSTDDFFSGGFQDFDENDSNTEEQQEETEVPKKRKRDSKETVEEESEESGAESGDEEVHKKNLKNLKKLDPEFYQFLEENDRGLLDFGDVGDDDDDDDEEKTHKPPEKLEVASDESDFEEEGATSRPRGAVTLALVEEWKQKIQKDKTSKILREVLEAFQAALQCVVAEKERVPCKYQVEGSAVFNAVLRLCVTEVQPAIKRILNLPANSKLAPTKSKNWTKIRARLRAYLLDLTQLCQVTSPGMLTVLLKHVHQMLPYAVCFPNIATKFLSRLVGLWTSESDVVRVLSFLCLLRIANLRRVLLSYILKKMYLAFVRNSKFVSPSSLSGINFLRQSLAEMFALDPVLSYQHAFLYIRQLSIHLRNAVTLKKKESYQAVYNWQYIQSLHLWSQLLCLAPEKSPLSGLIYPLVQITIGTIKLVPSPQYYPLRFHCVKLLLPLIEKKGVFIPVLPFLLEVLTDYDFNKKHSKVSMKPLELSCVLRCSKLQMQENGYKDAIIEWLCALLLETFAAEGYRVSFPDFSIHAVIQIKQFLKTCKVSKYSKQLKAVLEKVQDNAKFVEAERNKCTLRLDDKDGIATIEAGIKAKGVPIIKYYESWKKLHLQQQAKKITDNESIGEYNLPSIKKFEPKPRGEGPVELFPSDDEDDKDVLFAGEDSEDEDNKPSSPAKKRKKKENNKKKMAVGSDKKIEMPSDWPDVEANDIVEDLHVSDLDD